jgi:L-aspartate oxidase
MNRSYYDIIIIGRGAAAIWLALHTDPQCRVAILSKDKHHFGASEYAQGGVAAATTANDSPEQHMQDTFIAGANLCDPEATEITAKSAPDIINKLISLGTPFTTENQQYHLNQEGGHSRRRVYHCDDRTGKAMMNTLNKNLKKKPNITILEEYTAIDLLHKDNHCYGVTALTDKHHIINLTSTTVVLATGGMSSIYKYTTSPVMASGDGIAMAWRANVDIANLEFNQFHPTSFYNPGHKPFLLTEALRGEGATLELPDGFHFMPDHHPLAELAPRDIVSRAIESERKKHQLKYVLLNLTHCENGKIKKLFPSIDNHCKKYGFDITQDRIPTIPASHYSCGGIVTNLNGQTSMNGLYAIGETACTGLHGANRMASNSLLECLTFADRCGKHIKSQLNNKILSDDKTFTPQDPENTNRHTDNIEKIKKQLQHIMTEKIGVMRNDKEMQQAFKEINELDTQLKALESRQLHKTKYSIEIRNLIDCSLLVCRSAMNRNESRGAHYNTDKANLSRRCYHSIIKNNTITEQEKLTINVNEIT